MRHSTGTGFPIVGEVTIDNELCFLKLIRAISAGPAFVRELIQNAFDACDSEPVVRFALEAETPPVVEENEVRDSIDAGGDVDTRYSKRIWNYDMASIMKKGPGSDLTGEDSVPHHELHELTQRLTSLYRSVDPVVGLLGTVKLTDETLDVSFLPGEDLQVFEMRKAFYRDMQQLISDNRELIEANRRNLEAMKAVYREAELLIRNESGTIAEKRIVLPEEVDRVVQTLSERAVRSVTSVLQVENARGMTVSELNALTLVGYSTKSDKSIPENRSLRGEFGTGFILSLSPHIEPVSVVVETTCEGERWRLELRYENDQYTSMPVKTLTRSDEIPVNNTRVTVLFRKEAERVRDYLVRIMESPGRPLRLEIDGILFKRCQSLSARSLDDFSFYSKGRNGNEFYVKTGKPSFTLPTDLITVSVKDLPVVHHQSSYHFLTGYESGDHMPQNERGSVYLDSNVILINAKTVELNSSRDSIMRNGRNFENLKTQLDVDVKGPLLEKVNKWADSNAQDFAEDSLESILRGGGICSERDLYRHQDLANIYTLSSKIQAVLRSIDDGGCTTGTNDQYEKFIHYLLDRKLFSQAESRQPEKLSLREAHAMSHGCILYDDEKTDASRETLVRSLLRNHDHPILVDESISFMGNFRNAVSSLAAAAMPKPVYSLTDILSNRDVRRKLTEMGVLAEVPLQARIEISDEELTEDQRNFLREVRGWFMKTLRPLFGNNLDDDKFRFALGTAVNPADKPVLGFVETVQTKIDGLLFILGLDTDLWKKAIATDWKKSSYFVVSIMIYELCHVPRENVNFSDFLSKLELDLSPAKLELKLSEILLDIFTTESVPPSP